MNVSYINELEFQIKELESVEKVILNIFFWNGTNGMDLKTKRGAEMFRKNRNITIPDIENLEFKKKIFSCEKTPKTSPLKTQIISFLKSNEADEFNKMMMWINSDNTKIKNLIKSICLSLNIIEQSIKYDDKLNALEQVETIKMLLNNILESEKCDL